MLRAQETQHRWYVYSKEMMCKDDGVHERYARYLLCELDGEHGLVNWLMSLSSPNGCPWFASAPDQIKASGCRSSDRAVPLELFAWRTPERLRCHG